MREVVIIGRRCWIDEVVECEEVKLEGFFGCVFVGVVLG